MSIRLSATESLIDKTSYGIYCVNIFGSGLNSIKNEFKRQVHSGLRQNVFVLDLDEVQIELVNQPRNTKIQKDAEENLNLKLTDLILRHIQRIRKRHQIQIKQINEELTFDLYQYWLKQNEHQETNTLTKTQSSKPPKRSKEAKELKEKDSELFTSTLQIKKHNRMGQSMPLSKLKYIKDEPILKKLYIIILGQMGQSFYTDLLSRDRPLEGIINFIPTEGKYDIMLGNNKLRNFINSTLETINHSIYNLRQEITLQPVGLFTHELPVISSCLAARHSQEIFNQLIWSIYDIDVLKQQYDNYYLKAFQLTNVAMPANEDLTQPYRSAETLKTPGPFQKPLMPSSSADMASIAAYLNALLSTCDLQENSAEEAEQKENFANKFPKSFSTVTNISKYNKLVVAENNKLLFNMLQYTNLDEFQSINLCCLDYHVFGKFAISRPQECEYSQTNYSLTLPKYAKYYADADCSCQRITELLDAYDEYEIQSISPGYKLYIFKRNYNVLNESDDYMVIPTPLCFRDFTLFKKEEFLESLSANPSYNKSRTASHNSEQQIPRNELQDNIFIRPNSLKALVTQNQANSEEIESKKSVSRLSTNGTESLAQSFTEVEESKGLPPDHHLLKGYNLDDTLQEIKHKVSKYYFHYGFIKLYKEKWCFQEMNKQLSLSINNSTLFFSTPRHQLKGVSNNIRLITKNNISIRILDELKERSKIVMYYPNGLSVLHHRDYCEQIWCSEETPQKEQKRIFTTFGAIIVFYKSADMTMVMRYNGEIYRLYNTELEVDAAKTEDNQFNNSTKEEYNRKISQRDSSLAIELTRTKNLHQETIRDCKSVCYELKFLNILCSIYDLSYTHVKITTSGGKRFNLTHRGQIFEKDECLIKEWHDFCVNEIYCERSDGVKTIWNQNYFKCFHEDGTAFKTSTEEIVAEEDTDEQDNVENNKLSTYQQKSDEQLEQPTLEKMSLSSNSINTTGETAEEHQLNDIQFQHYNNKSWLMQHPNYAQVFMKSAKVPNSIPDIEIFGIDNIRMYVENIDEQQQSESEEIVEEKTSAKLIVNVWIGENLHVTADNTSCTIYAAMSNTKLENDFESDSLIFSLNYTDCINDAFKHLVSKIASVNKNSERQELEKLYFVEKTNDDSSIRGFEFFPTLPEVSQYKYHVSNNLTELTGIKTINKSLVYNCEEYEKDFKKFCHFKQKANFCSKFIHDIPEFLSANVFIEIPEKLRSLTNVTKFLEPFENIHFKSLRRKFKNVLSHYLKPQQQLYLQLLISKNNWKKRHGEQEKRLFIEKQRLGLYNAMNKHNIYPNFWTFTQIYGGNVKHIDFFNFMQNQCEKTIAIKNVNGANDTYTK